MIILAIVVGILVWAQVSDWLKRNPYDRSKSAMSVLQKNVVDTPLRDWEELDK